jgi:hypothetical protein
MMQSGSAAIDAEIGQSLADQTMVWGVACGGAVLGGYLLRQQDPQPA